jgi:5'-nucleotidase
MRVLVTNDDGVEAPGLFALATAIAAAGHDVIVVAPSGERSGSGAAIGRLHRSGPIAWTPVHWPDLPGVDVHSVDVPPAAAVYAGCFGAFGARPDVVASGVNPGLNYGHLVIHSGTVGAGLAANVLGIPAVAVSVAWGEEEQWTTAATLAAAAVPWLGSLERPALLNLNVPNVALAEVKGVRAADLGGFNEVWTAATSPGELLLEYVGHDHEPHPDSDLAIVRSGYAASTMLSGVTGIVGGMTDDATHASEAVAAVASALV